MSDEMTVESLTAYYKQSYCEGEYSVGDLCVMLARAESALKEETVLMLERENDELRAAIVEWEEMWDEVESMDPEELTDDNLNQISEWYMRYLAACDRLRAIAKGSAR